MAILIDFVAYDDDAKDSGGAWGWDITTPPAWGQPESSPADGLWILSAEPGSLCVGDRVSLKELQGDPACCDAWEYRQRTGIVHCIECRPCEGRARRTGVVRKLLARRVVIRVLDLPTVDPDRTINYRQDGAAPVELSVAVTNVQAEMQQIISAGWSAFRAIGAHMEQIVSEWKQRAKH